MAWGQSTALVKAPTVPTQGEEFSRTDNTAALGPELWEGQENSHRDTKSQGAQRGKKARSYNLKARFYEEA